MQMTLISFNDIPLHEPPLQASSSPIPKIRICSIAISHVAEAQLPICGAGDALAREDQGKIP